MFRFMILVLTIAAAAVLGFVIDAQSRTPVEHPERQIEPRTIFAMGRIEGVTEEIELRPQLAGRIEAIRVEEGQVVEKDAVLVELDDQQYRHEVAQAAAELELAKAQLEHLMTGARPEQRREAAAKHRVRAAELERAQLAWKRISELREAKAVAPQEADDHRLTVAALTAEVEAAKAQVDLIEAPPRQDEVHMDQARVEAAKARLELAKVQLDRTKLCAPIRGQVLKIDANPGELTGPESPQPIVVLADTSAFRVRAFVEEYDAPRVRIGMPAKIKADGIPGKEFSGKVVRFSPYMTRKELWSDLPSERYDTKTREVWIDLDRADGLVVGLRVEVAIDASAVAN